METSCEATAALEEVQVLEGHTDRVWCVAWSPSGTPPLAHALPSVSGSRWR